MSCIEKVFNKNSKLIKVKLENGTIIEYDNDQVTKEINSTGTQTRNYDKHGGSQLSFLPNDCVDQKQMLEYEHKNNLLNNPLCTWEELLKQRQENNIITDFIEACKIIKR